MFQTIQLLVLMVNIMTLEECVRFFFLNPNKFKIVGSAHFTHVKMVILANVGMYFKCATFEYAAFIYVNLIFLSHVKGK